MAVLVVVNAAFAGTELALVSLREGQLQRLEGRSATATVHVEIRAMRGRTITELALTPTEPSPAEGPDE